MGVLARHGANPAARDENGESPAEAAAKRGHADAAASCRPGAGGGGGGGTDAGRDEAEELATSVRAARVSETRVMRSRGHPAVLGASLGGRPDPRPRAEGFAETGARARAHPRPRPRRRRLGLQQRGRGLQERRNLARMSAEAKRKGNEAFAAGDYAKAAKQFTMAIRMDKKNHVLFSEPVGGAVRAGEVRGGTGGRGAVREAGAEVGEGGTGERARR